MVNILGNLIAGLGLFFIGVRLIGDNMKQMAGRRFRQMVGQITGHPATSLFCGLMAGGLLQSATAVTFILASLVSSRLVTVTQALPIIAWSNVGNSLLVILAVLDLRAVALYLLGIAGFGYYLKLDKSARYRVSVGAVLGLGLLFLGLVLMKTGAGPLKDLKWFSGFLAETRTSYLIAFAVGGVLTFIAQSSTTVSVVAIALAHLGLMGAGQTVMIIYGSNVGSGCSAWFMASNHAGTSKQLAIFQAVFKIAGAVVLVPWFFAELDLGVPDVSRLVEALSPDFGRQMSYVYLIFQLVSAFATVAARRPILRLIERLSPATVEEELSRPAYIRDEALVEPQTALDLVEKEQIRLLRRLPDFLDSVRLETSGKPAVGAAALCKTVAGVAAEVTAFMTELMDQGGSRDSLERALNLQNRNALVVSLAETLNELVVAAPSGSSAKLAALCNRLAEALHLVLTTACDATEDPGDENLQIFLGLTGDRNAMMQQIRRSFLQTEASLTLAEQQTLMTVTALFERAVWLLRRLGVLLSSGQAPVAVAGEPGMTSVWRKSPGSERRGGPANEKDGSRN